MKIKSFIIVVIAILLTACSPAAPNEVTRDIPTAALTAEVTMAPAFTATREPVGTNTPTITPSSTPTSCPTLLTPLNDAEIPALGKVTFAWEPVDRATIYVLNIIQPSGQTTSFETKQTSRGQYMEAFPAGGSYRWSVTAYTQDQKRSEICRSILAKFTKPFYDQPQQPGSDPRKKN